MKIFLGIASIFFCGYSLRGASSKDIFGMIAVNPTACDIAKENPEAVRDLFHCVTAKESEEATPLLLAQITEKTGLSVEPEDVLISLDICDSSDTQAEPRTNGECDSDFCSQLTDSKGQQAKICGMWPYNWFMHAKEGDVIKILLWGGEFLAHLIVAPRSEINPYPFCEEIAFYAGYTLARKQMAEDENLRDLRNKISTWQSLLRTVPVIDSEDRVQARDTREKIVELSEEVSVREAAFAWQAVKERYGISCDDE